MTTITLEHLRHFAAAVENQGVLKASEKLFISPSSITRSIKLVEESVGERLFDRVGRNIRLNSAGQVFYRRSHRFLEEYGKLWSKSEAAEADLSGHYTLGASHFLCVKVLSTEIARLGKRFPRASFEVRSYDSNELVRKVHRGEVDFGLSFSPKASERIAEKKLASGDLLLCAGKRNPLVGRPFAEIRSELANVPAIIHRPADSVERCDHHPMFRSHRIQPRIQTYWDSDAFAIEVLAAGETWSMLPDRVIQSDPRVVALAHPRDWKAPYHISLIWNSARANTRVLEELAEIKLESSIA